MFTFILFVFVVLNFRGVDVSALQRAKVFPLCARGLKDSCATLFYALRRCGFLLKILSGLTPY